MSSNLEKMGKALDEDNEVANLMWKWRKQNPAHEQPELMRMAISGRVVSSARCDAVGSCYLRCAPTTQHAKPAKSEDSYNQYSCNHLNDLHTIVTLLRQQQPLLS